MTGVRQAAATAISVAVGSLTLGAAGSPVTAEPDVPESAPVDKRVYIVADSVGLGARGALPDAFPSDWQVVLDGTPALFVERLESKYVRAVPQSLLGDYGVIAGGYNYPYWDPERFDRSIDSIIRAFAERGVKHVFWVTLREVKPQYITAGAWSQVQPYYWYFPTVNDHLERALDRHPNLTLIDWAAVADRSGITYDAIHLNTTGAQLYSSLVRQAVDAATHRVAAGSVTRIAVPDAAGTAAVALNLTTTSPRTTGFLTAFPCDSATPVVSNHNHARDQVVASAAIVPVSSSGEVCVYSFTDTNLIVDITGRLPTGTGVVAAGPQRLADTRNTGANARQPAGVPLRVAIPAVAGVATTAAVALDVTAVGADGPGFATVYPCDEAVPETSNVNYGTGAATPNLTIVRPGPTGEVCVVASSDVHLLVDLFAAFDATAELTLATPVPRARHAPPRRRFGRRRVDERDRRRCGRCRAGRRWGARQHHRHPGGRRRVPDRVPVRLGPPGRLQPERHRRARRRQLRARRARSGRPCVRLLQHCHPRHRRHRRLDGRHVQRPDAATPPRHPFILTPPLPDRFDRSGWPNVAADRDVWPPRLDLISLFGCPMPGG